MSADWDEPRNARQDRKPSEEALYKVTVEFARALAAKRGLRIAPGCSVFNSCVRGHRLRPIGGYRPRSIRAPTYVEEVAFVDVSSVAGSR
jgi:hypothetical protein